MKRTHRLSLAQRELDLKIYRYLCMVMVLDGRLLFLLPWHG
jgi:hypothetical protein